MKNKKAATMFVFVLFITSIIGFFVILNSFTNYQDFISSNSEDLACRALVQIKDFSKLGLGVYLYKLSSKCKVDKIKNLDLSDNSNGNAFKKIAVETNRCWYKYGEGKFDFLSNWDTQGKWCFECAQINFKDNGASYSYKDYIKWASNNYPSKKNEREKKSYLNLTNIKYTKVSGLEISKIRNEFENILHDSSGEQMDPSLIPMVDILSKQIVVLDDMRTKSISAQDKKIYVVYRYDRINRSLNQQLTDATSGAKKGILTGALVSIGAEMAAESLVMAGVSGSVCAFSGIGTIFTPVCGIVGGVVGAGIGIVKGFFKTIKATIKLTEKLTKISVLSKKIKNLIQSSKSIKASPKLIEYTYSGNKIIKISKRIMDFKATTKEIEAFSEIAKKSGDINTYKNFKILVEFMKENGIKNLAQIDKKIIYNTNSIKKIEKFISNEKMYSELSIRGGRGSQLQKPIIDEIGDLKALKNLAKSEVSKIKNGNFVEPFGIKNYIRASLVIGGGIAGAYLGNVLNSNYQQYVDLLTREQYYRSCGTQRFPNN